MKTDNQLKEEIKLKIAISKLKEEGDIAMKTSKISKRKTIIAACTLFTLTTGIVFAKDIENFVKNQFENFNLGKGITTAIENGYIGKSKDNTTIQKVEVIKNNEKIDRIKTTCDISEFLVTDTNLSVNFSFEIENKINNYVDLGKNINENIDYESSYIIELSDLFIIDENNEILYLNHYNNKFFKDFCNKNNLTYDLSELDKFSNNINVKKFYNKNDMLGIDLVCNFTSSKIYPVSKQLKIYFTEITLTEPFPNENDIQKITLNGDWSFVLDIPEVMYNRKDISYKVINCENENIDVYRAKLTETGFELGLKLLNTENPAYPIELSDREKELLNNNRKINRSYFS